MLTKDRVVQAYKNIFNIEPRFVAIAPGRVNILGEHVDFNDGFVMPAAIDRATYIAFSPSDDGTHHIHALDFQQTTDFDNHSLLTKDSIFGEPLVEWATYPAGIAWALLEAELTVNSINAVFASDVPRGAGLSSSASVEMAFALAWQVVGGWKLPPMRRAQLGQMAENQYVGVNCGIMDQFSSACGVADRLLLLDCRSLDWRPVPIPADYAIVIADTSVRRKLTDGEYNKRRQACDQAVEILSKFIPNVTALRDVSVEDFEKFKSNLPKIVEKRARHVVEEIDRSVRSIILLEAGEIEKFGAIMNQAHVSLRDLYEVSIPELNAMVEIAQNLPGCVGARLTGAGFGGCTVNLVKRDQATLFASDLAKLYEQKTSLKPEITITQATDGARLLD